MNDDIRHLIDMLESEHSLDERDYRRLIAEYSSDAVEYAAERAVVVRKKIYGSTVYMRGLIEISNICKNNCLYCGIRRGNELCERYRLDKQQILECCRAGYSAGFRTFVLQGGEDPYYSDEVLCDIIREIKCCFPDCAVTLSLGERDRESYKALRDAGADRYLLRHETASKAHYEKLHPPEMSFDNRMKCLYELKKLGFQTGCGMMVGSPGQTEAELAKDLVFIEHFKPEMCGIGPFIPHDATPFRNEPSGSVELTLYLLSLVRLICPNVLLPATTALGTARQNGRELGILAGANVVMPNLSPVNVREKYKLYNNKLYSGAEAAECRNELAERIHAIGYELVSLRGDCERGERTSEQVS